ncbi:MAG: carboxyl-terminal protease [Flavobacteriaceae bacterium]|nr:carboxyl-terminal protease [Flavobacteriaceae bacterium]
MKIRLHVLLLMVLCASLTSCFEDQDDNGVFASEINDFVWKGMNAVYLYKDNIPDLANDRFSSDEEYADFLNASGSPEQLFESLIYQRQTVDKFSWIVDDYIALEQQFSGISKRNGMKFGLRFVPGSNTDLYGYVRLVLPNSDAENKGLQRGDVFFGIDGTPLTLDNYISLLGPDTYSIDLATYDNNGTAQTDDDSIIPGTESVSLTKSPYTENPIFHSDVLTVGAEKVGYLMYNGFTRDFDDQLNTVFAGFLAENVQHLVLDLRYNPGGSVNTSILLSGMITGQFNGEVYSTEQWNSDLQEQFFQQDPELLINRFKNDDGGTPLNSLNLSQVYILTTGSSASASELVINCLNPYIDVVQIGTTTTGKYQASITVYDSPDLGREGANPNHTYAMQPLVLKSLNSVGFTDYDNGLPPDIEISEDISNLGVLGDENEPLLAVALDEIAGTRSGIPAFFPVELVGDDDDLSKFSKSMYITKKIPKEIKQQLKP